MSRIASSMDSTGLNQTAANSARTMRLTPEDIKRIRRTNPRAKIMEVREKPLPDLGPHHTRKSLKDPSSEDGGLVPWLKRCAEIAAAEWKAIGVPAQAAAGEADTMAEEALESRVADRVRAVMTARGTDGATSSDGGAATLSRDTARCIGFPRLLAVACSLRVYRVPKSLEGVFMLVDAHRQLMERSGSRGSKARSGAQRRLERAKIRALTRANAIFEGRLGPAE